MHLSRRGFIKSASALSFLTVPKLLKAIPQAEKKLHLYHVHTGEWLREVIAYKGHIPPEILHRINHFMRDWRTNTYHAMDPALVTLMLRLKEALPVHAHFDVICGYRSSQTNAILRKKNRGVAKNSLHCKGKAIDLSSPQVHLKDLAFAAKQLKMGGVGYYPASGFIHVDIRDKPTSW